MWRGWKPYKWDQYPYSRNQMKLIYSFSHVTMQQKAICEAKNEPLLNTKLLVPWFWTSYFSEWWTINFCQLCYLICATLLPKSEMIMTDIWTIHCLYVFTTYQLSSINCFLLLFKYMTLNSLLPNTCFMYSNIKLWTQLL